MIICIVINIYRACKWTVPLHKTMLCVCVCAGLVIVCHVANTQLEEAQKKEMIRYLRNVQRQDGGWGL